MIPNLVMNANIDVKNKKITGSGFLKDYIIPESLLVIQILAFMEVNLR